ncbi:MULTISPECIES: maltose acetyltransferase domain-containing protein [Gammaproteobacteria]|uniref:maltose acetyltransferase domain-containing protein n=1 Tax=Gammaproteobacteria TaxID=1236 RepID=UPI001ADA0BC5|nr:MULTISPECIES: maltose acetyltransferase domain-containing protein [Gammaproteobacteria]MBO9480746.1 hypothetical protein [Salinisphaera sp. G21_0]MBO9495501.1 hypothetical protein [Thalassotalea sp. G20_0]
MSLDEIKSKMHNSEIYFSDDQALVDEQTQCLEILYDYNHTRPSESKKREQIPANVVAVGNPCRVLREIGQKDKEFYYKDLRFGSEVGQ